MRADPGFIDGILEWTQQAYLLTHSAIRHWDFPGVKRFRVCDVAMHIRDAHRFRYDISGGGSGCRYWVRVIVSNMTKKGRIASTSANSLWPDLLYRYHTIQNRKPPSMVQGTFH
ncbi:hypothetical protein PV08_06293 [Exophiala spinifera]|uniref:DUF7770 domain-containing protein n=1 Tax=Exophiala spinifera TaxID=91928 RepID=A0A0D1ZTW4_9EURO|nr:uncharacterized protein PV08_06293 [Exophiala spinifera]KIW16242.1 hypothetical protein PV08_06293 [Exophiala spinifera]